MHTLLRLLLVMLLATGTGSPLLAATTSSKGKKSSQSASSSKKKAPAKSDSTPDKAETTPAKKTTPTEPVNEDPPTSVPTPAAVSTLSIEDIRDFDSYPKQIQSLVQSCLALTHLDLGYLYGSHEPSKGGMDCSGTIYHVLHFQGLKDVPRQSDEMCNWVDKKGHLYLTPTATSFDSEEFTNLKPGDLLFWTNSLETTRKLPVTHVMIYLGKLKKSGKRVVFGSSDGRSYMGERRSGVSVFDFSLPKPDSTKHFYGYGPTPGLLPVEPERPVIASVTPPVPAPEPTLKETAVSKEATTPKEMAAVKETPAPKVVAKSQETETNSDKKSAALKETPEPKVAALTKEAPASKEAAEVKESPAAPKEEVRKAVAVSTETSPDSATKKTVVAEAKSDAPSKASTTTAKPKTTATKKRSTTVSSTTRRRTPAAPPKSVFEQKVDRAVSSVRRFFQQ